MIERRQKPAVSEKEAAGFKLERIMGIEPTYPAWEAGVLPMNYIRSSVNEV